jgi:hypothetical protein
MAKSNQDAKWDIGWSDFDQIKLPNSWYFEWFDHLNLSSFSNEWQV